MKTYSFFAAGDPRGQPRPRAFVFKGQARIYNPAQAESWKTCIAEAARQMIPAQPITGPVALDLTFYFKRPQTHFGTGKNAGRLKDIAPRYHTQKPDRDNAEKAVMDALTILGFWQDDDQVCDGFIRKLWCPVGQPAGCEISITELAEPVEQETLVEQREMNALLA